MSPASESNRVRNFPTHPSAVVCLCLSLSAVVLGFEAQLILDRLAPARQLYVFAIYQDFGSAAA
jgi:hypothetical protein